MRNQTAPKVIDKDVSDEVRIILAHAPFFVSEVLYASLFHCKSGIERNVLATPIVGTESSTPMWQAKPASEKEIWWWDTVGKEN